MTANRAIALSAITFSTLSISTSGFSVVPSYSIGLHNRPFHKLAKERSVNHDFFAPLHYSKLQRSTARNPILSRISSNHVKTACSGVAVAAAAAVLLSGSPALAEGIASTSPETLLSSAAAALTSATAAGNALLAGSFALFTSPEARDLGVYLAKTLIAWGVPVGAVGIVVLSAVARASRRGEDSAFESDSPQSLLAMLRGQKPGEPVEYLKIQRYPSCPRAAKPRPRPPLPAFSAEAPTLLRVLPEFYRSSGIPPSP